MWIGELFVHLHELRELIEQVQMHPLVSDIEQHALVRRCLALALAPRALVRVRTDARTYAPAHIAPHRAHRAPAPQALGDCEDIMKLSSSVEMKERAVRRLHRDSPEGSDFLLI